MKHKILKFSILAISMLLFVSMINGVNAIEFNQAEPSFTSSPTDRTISTNISITLEWKVSSSVEASYNIIMENEGGETAIVSSGIITPEPVKLTLDRLPVGNYIFAFKLLYDTGYKFSNATIQVQTDTQTSEESTIGGLPGLTFPLAIIGIFTTLVINKKRKNKLTP